VSHLRGQGERLTPDGIPGLRIGFKYPDGKGRPQIDEAGAATAWLWGNPSRGEDLVKRLDPPGPRALAVPAGDTEMCRGTGDAPAMGEVAVECGTGRGVAWAAAAFMELRCPDEDPISPDILEPQVPRLGHPHAGDRQEPKQGAIGVGAPGARRPQATGLLEEVWDVLVTADVGGGRRASAAEPSHRRELVTWVLRRHKTGTADERLQPIRALGFCGGEGCPRDGGGRHDSGRATCGGNAREVTEVAFDGHEGKPRRPADGERVVHLGHEHEVTSGQGLATSWRSPTSTLA
jgi:hypothetical protein